LQAMCRACKKMVLSTLGVFSVLRTTLYLRFSNSKLQSSICQSRQLLPVGAFASTHAWQCYDERWSRVKYRWEHRAKLQQGKSLSYVSESPSEVTGLSILSDMMRVDVSANGQDRWVYCYLAPESFMWRDFRWRFKVCRLSGFRELQFGFRYRDFYNRYRFRHEEDSFHFDVVQNGMFFNSLVSRPFVMDLQRSYTIDIEARGWVLRLWVDRKLVLQYFDGQRRFREGSIAIILWEDNGCTPIQADLSEMQVEDLSDF